MQSFTKFISLVFFIVFIGVISIFASKMTVFKEEVSSMDDKMCLKENGQMITTQDDCLYKYNGTLSLDNYNNVPSMRICCQLPLSK